MKWIITCSLLLPVSIMVVGHAVHAATADDLDCIRCVDTTDINYDAVTSNRMLDGTIRSADLGQDAMTSSRIKAGEVRTSDLAPNAVTSSRILNGAVTEAKLAQELLDMIILLQAKSQRSKQKMPLNGNSWGIFRKSYFMTRAPVIITRPYASEAPIFNWSTV